MKVWKIASFLVLLLMGLKVHAQSSEELKRRRDRYNEELEQLNREYAETANNKRSTLRQLSNIREQINIREQKINTINSEVRLLDNQISESNATVHNLRNQLDQLKKEYAAMIRFAYHNQSAYNELMFIFASKDFNQGYKRLKYLQEFAGYRQRQAQYIEGTERNLHLKINELDNSKKQKSDILADQIKEKSTLAKQHKQEALVVADLSKQQGQLKQQQRELQRKIARTNQEIKEANRREIAEARRKAEEAARAAAAAANAAGARTSAAARAKPITSSSTTSEVLRSTPEGARISDDFLGNRGHLPWPVANGIITRGMGIYYLEGIKTESDGVEIRTNSGAPVRTVFEGSVKSVVNVYGSYFVVVQHGEYFTAYSNMKTVTVAKGQKVSAKQMLGTVATDPMTGECTVQFSLYKGANPVDPKSWLSPE